MARGRLIARRKALGYTQQSLAHRVQCERTTVARWEREHSAISAHYRGPLADALGWTLTELDEAINGNDVLPQADQGWWSNYVTLEQSAVSVRTWEPMVVPGLLQTRAYARALNDDEDVVQRRLDRQRMLTRPTMPVELVAVIDESVLHRPIGGSGVLADQVRYLTAMADRPNVVIQILPFAAPLQPANWGSMVILEFKWPGGLVYLEHAGGSHSLDSRHDIDAHSATFDQLRRLALSPRESMETISNRAMELSGDE